MGGVCGGGSVSIGCSKTGTGGGSLGIVQPILEGGIKRWEGVERIPKESYVTNITARRCTCINWRFEVSILCLNFDVLKTL